MDLTHLFVFTAKLFVVYKIIEISLAVFITLAILFVIGGAIYFSDKEARK